MPVDIGARLAVEVDGLSTGRLNIDETPHRVLETSDSPQQQRAGSHRQLSDGRQPETAGTGMPGPGPDRPRKRRSAFRFPSGTAAPAEEHAGDDDAADASGDGGIAAGGSDGSEDTSEAVGALSAGDGLSAGLGSDQAVDAFQGELGAAVRSLEDAVADERVFLRPSADVSAAARAAAKALFDHIDSLSAAAAAAGELYVEGFDAEQIWGQLELQAGPLLRRAARLIRRIGPDPLILPPDLKEALDAQLAGSDAGDGSDDDASGEDVDGDELQSADDNPASGVSGEEDFEEELGGSEGDEPRDSAGEDGDEDAEAEAPYKRRKRKRLPGEDANLRFDEMEAYLQDAERADAQQRGFDEDRPDEEDGDGDESEGDEEGLEDGDVESGSDAELAAVLEHASGLVGRKAGPGGAGKKRRRQAAGVLDGSDDEDDDEDRGAGDMYADFFSDGGRGDAAQDSEEDEEGPAPKAERRKGARRQAVAEDRDDEQDDDGVEEDGWDGEQLFDTGEGREGDDDADAGEDAAPESDDAELPSDDEEDGDAAGHEPKAPQSKHERRQAALAARIAALEAANMAEKDWFMRGEAKAEARPLNSALGMDLDFERTSAPPPQPTEEATASLEDVIRQRVADQRWDDVPRVAPPPPETRRAVLELDDSKSGKGLGELYEEVYQKAAGFAAEDADEPLRQEARTALRRLAAKLDALSHYSFAPRPVVEDMVIRADVPALAMEDVAPQVVSEAAMRYPEEVYRPEGRGGAAPAAEAELSREERRARRGAKKRTAKKHRTQKDSDKRALAAAAAVEGAPLGRKSEAAAAAADAENRQRRKGRSKARSEYTQSAKVFGKLQDAAEAAAAGVTLPAKKRIELKGAPSGLKL